MKHLIILVVLLLPSVALATNSHSSNIISASTQAFTAVDSASLAPATNMSIGFWVYLMRHPSAGTWNFGVGKDIVGSREYALGVFESGGTSRISAQISGNGTTVNEGTSVINLETWTHLGFNWNTATDAISYYVNGTLDTTTTYLGVDPADTTADIAIGRRLYDGLGAANNNPMSAYIDDVRIYNENHNWADDYNCDLLSTTTAIKAYWELDNTLTDASGNANTLTNVNTVTFSATNTPFTNDCSVPGIAAPASQVILFE